MISPEYPPGKRKYLRYNKGILGKQQATKEGMIMGMRVYTVDGQKATFNKVAFQHYLKEKSHLEKISISKLEQRLAEQLQIAANTVHKWNYNGGGPIDYSTVRQLATAMDLADSDSLLTYINTGENNMTHLTDRQLSAVKRIYDMCIWFLYEFNNTDGFHDYWSKFKKNGSTDPEADIADFADELRAKVRLVLDQEYFDLHNCEIYGELCDFVYEDLMNIYDGKLSYGYRFEAIVDGNPTLSDDYDKAMIRLNSIIEKYYNA